MTTVESVGKIEQVNIDALIPYVRNSRTHSEAQIAQIAASIKEFGFTNPVLIDEDGGIIAGHGRTMAARKLGLTEVPCIRLSHLTDIQRKAYVIADNKLALNAGWDNDLLKLELQELHELGFDINFVGFNVDELNTLLDLNDLNEAEYQDEKSVTNDSRFLLLIDCEDERELESLFAEMQQRGKNVKVMD